MVRRWGLGIALALLAAVGCSKENTIDASQNTYVDCTQEDTFCTADGTKTDACVNGNCVAQSCDTNRGGVVKTICGGATPYCSKGACVGTISPEAPGAVVQVPAPGGGTYGIDSTEVTRAQYIKFVNEMEGNLGGQSPECESNATFVPGADWPFADRPNLPVAFVDWCDAFAYCKWAGKRLCGKIGGGANAWGDYANASMSQWFNACSGGGAHNYPYGGNPQTNAVDGYDGQNCNGYDRGAGQTMPVATSPDCVSTESGYAGVYDLSGNLWEWEDSCNGTTGSGDACHLRGGSFNNKPDNMRCAHDSGVKYPRSMSNANFGFRCCSDP